MSLVKKKNVCVYFLCNSYYPQAFVLKLTFLCIFFIEKNEIKKKLQINK